MVRLTAKLVWVCRLLARPSHRYEAETDSRKWLNVAVYTVVIAYLFLGIAVICDDYFCTSLEVICAKLKLSEQVSGGMMSV